MALPNRLLYPPEYDREKDVPLKDFAFIRSLQIDEMVVLIRESHRGFQDLKLETYFSTDPEVLSYRLEIVKDLVENPSLYDVFCKSINMIQNISDLRRSMSSDYSAETALSSVRYLETYQEIIELFTKGLKEVTPTSRGLKNFRNGILEVHDGAEYQNLCSELTKMDVYFGGIKSVTVGVNLNENMQVKEAGLISLGDKPFRAGSLMDRLLKKTDENTLISPLYPMAKGLHREEWGALNSSIQTALDTIFTKSLRHFEPVIQQYFSINTSSFTGSSG